MSNSQIIQYISETYKFGWLKAALIDRIVNNMTYDDLIIKYCYSLNTVQKLRMFKEVEQDVQSAEHKDMGDIIRVLDPKAFDTSVGHWKIDDDKEVIICSRCHTWFNADDRFKYMRYCPNCGAKMAEGD